MLLALGLLIARVRVPQVVERGSDSQYLHLVCLGVSIVLAASSLLVLFGLWFGLTLAIRTRVQASRRALRISRAVR
jgi:hypothetical protein